MYFMLQHTGVPAKFEGTNSDDPANSDKPAIFSLQTIVIICVCALVALIVIIFIIVRCRKKQPNDVTPKGAYDKLF
jgi:hypothetical protein